MNVNSFDKNKIVWGHNHTIMCQAILPEGMSAPFDSWYCYLEAGKVMEGHAHPKAEIYIIMNGEGHITVGEEKRQVLPGDTIELPPNVWHDIENTSSEPLFFAAMLWDMEDK